MSDPSLYEDTFTVSSIISGKYERVHRMVGTAASGDTSMTLDVNIELFPLAMGDSVHILLASSLAPDGTQDETKGWRDIANGEPSLADHYEYVCHGKMYRFADGEGGNLKCYASFGGLLLYIDGPNKKLTSLRVDNIYLLMRKT